jgi:hypothetical protein
LLHVVDANHIPTDCVRVTEIVEIELPELSTDAVVAVCNEKQAQDKLAKVAKVAALQAEIAQLEGK